MLTVRFAVAVGVFARAIGPRGACGRPGHGGITESTASSRNAGIRSRTTTATSTAAAGLAGAALCARAAAGRTCGTALRPALTTTSGTGRTRGTAAARTGTAAATAARTARGRTRARHGTGGHAAGTGRALLLETACQRQRNQRGKSRAMACNKGGLGHGYGPAKTKGENGAGTAKQEAMPEARAPPEKLPQLTAKVPQLGSTAAGGRSAVSLKETAQLAG